MRNAIDNQIVLRRRVVPNAVELDVLGDDLAATPFINAC